MDTGNFSRYEIREVLGKGGMSEVYRAYDPYFDRDVALKILRREMLEDTRLRERFERETKIIAKLEIEGIVPVYDIGRDKDQLFFVMRLMTGGSLSDRMQNGSILTAEIIRIVQRIAPALDEAHKRGIIHRDLKPSNILFDEHNNAFISDFGIAKSINISALSTLTDGGIVGTPRYMSPEQAWAELVDARSDIYSLGVIVFEMLIGKTRFDALSPLGLAFRDESIPVPSLLDNNPDLPPSVQAVIEKVLARNRDQRYDSAMEFANALTAALSEPVIPELRKLVYQKPRLLLRFWLIGGIVLLALAIFAVWRYPEFVTPTTPAPSTLTSVPSETPVPTLTSTATIEPTQTSTPTVEPMATLTSTVTATATQTSSTIGTTPYLIRNVSVTLIFFGLLGLLAYTTGNINFLRRTTVTNQKPVIYTSEKPLPPVPSETTMTTNLFAVVDPTKRRELLVLFGRDLEMRITNKIAYFGGGRYILHGFGRFGATALINQIVRKAEHEVARKSTGQGKGFIMTVHIDAATLEEKDEEIHAVIKELKYEAIHSHYARSVIAQVDRLDKQDKNHSADGNPSTDEKTISIKATIPGFETQYSRKFGNEKSSPKIGGEELLKLVRNFLDRAEQQNPHSLELLIDKVLGTTAVPTRIIFVIDHIKSEAVFNTIRRMRLFDEDRVTFFAIVKQEYYLPWIQNEDVLSLLKELKFQFHYMPCFWEERTNFVRDLITNAFGPNIIGDKSLLPDFIDHIAFLSRGAPAEAANETVKTDFCEYRSEKLILNLEKIPDIENMKANANLQRILARNWDAILSSRFKATKAEEADQARLAIYKLMDWMNSQKRFSFSTARKFALHSHLRISTDHQMTENILKTVLTILVSENYLMFNEGIYGVAHLTTPEDLLHKSSRNNRKKKTNSSKQINRSQRSNRNSSRRLV